MKRKLLAAVTALIFALACLPVSAFSVMTELYAPEQIAAETPTGPAEQVRDVPSGYSEHDYNKCAAFLEQEDENGVKNGTKLNADYDVSDPTTWRYFDWTEETPRRLYYVYLAPVGVCGELDLSGCTEMWYMCIDGNNLTKLNVSGCTSLDTLYIYENALTELDLSGCSQLTYIDCTDNALTAIDFSDVPYFPIDGVYAEEGGTIGFRQLISIGEPMAVAFAYPDEGKVFAGWYDPYGELVSEEAVFNVYGAGLTEITARFSDPFHTVTFVDGMTGEVLAEVEVEYGADAEPPEAPDHGAWYVFDGWDGDYTSVTENVTVTAVYRLLGDVDGDSELTAGDALTVMRYAMNIITVIDTNYADVNGDGAITLTDALLIMRHVMDLV